MRGILLLAVLLSGGSRGEVGRTWMLLVPPLLAGAVQDLEPGDFRVLGGACLATLLATSALLETSLGLWM